MSQYPNASYQSPPPPSYPNVSYPQPTAYPQPSVYVQQQPSKINDEL